jgi:hypothetical protein
MALNLKSRKNRDAMLYDHVSRRVGGSNEYSHAKSIYVYSSRVPFPSNHPSQLPSAVSNSAYTTARPPPTYTTTHNISPTGLDNFNAENQERNPRAMGFSECISCQFY